MSLSLVARFVVVGLVCLVSGAFFGSGCTALRRYSAEAYRRQVDRASQAEKKLAEVTAHQKAVEHDAIRAKLDAESSKKELANVREDMGELKAKNGVPEWASSDNWSKVNAELETLRRKSASSEALRWYFLSENESGVLRIRLRAKLPIDDLRTIATLLRGEHPNAASPSLGGRHIVDYYLPCMNDRVDGPWAQATFNKGMDDAWRIEVLGLTIEKQQTLVAATRSSLQQAMVGLWVDDGGKRLLALFRKEGTLFVQRRYEDNTADETELIESSRSGNRCFQYRTPGPDQEPGGYLLLTKDGTLEEWAPSDPKNRADLSKLGFRFDSDHGLYATAQVLVPISSETDAGDVPASR